MKEFSKKFPDPHARVTGIVYLLYFLSAVFALKFPKTDSWYIVINLISCGFYLALTILFYNLFKPVNKNISMFAAFCSLIGCAATVLYVLKVESININPLLFFGPYCILIGLLISKSIFLPHFLGILMIAAGLGWLIFLSPLEKYLSLYIKILGIFAEALLMFWLIIKGVSIQKWEAQIKKLS